MLKSALPFSARYILVAAALAATGACGGEPVVDEPLIRPVRTARVQSTGSELVRSFTGSTEASAEIALSFKVPGTVMRLRVRVGDAVKEGQLIAELEPSGWLGRGVDEIAEGLGLGQDLIAAALRLVQKRVEPAGLFARDLQECLRLQLEERDRMSAAMRLVLSHLPVLETGGPAGLVAATGLAAETVQACLAELRQLDPKPGSGFSSDPTLMREPDVRLTPAGDGWEIEFLSSLQEDVAISGVPRGTGAETRAALARARALKQALEIRRSALRQVVGEIVARQGAFFRDGPAALAPMTMSEIAAETGFHLSTVSRVLNGLLIEGPNGISAARTLFGGAASAAATQSKPAVQARLRVLLAGEDPRQPLSDRRLTALLEGEGIAISRRVVANYRQEIGVPAAAKRRLRA